jgi:hypothetical protein
VCVKTVAASPFWHPHVGTDLEPALSLSNGSVRILMALTPDMHEAYVCEAGRHEVVPYLEQVATSYLAAATLSRLKITRRLGFCPYISTPMR